MARGGFATKMSWDWSKAGRMDADGKPYTEKDAKGNIIYESKKGAFVVAENVIPEYVWFNGNVKFTLFGEKVTEDKVKINEFLGDEVL